MSESTSHQSNRTSVDGCKFGHTFHGNWSSELEKETTCTSFRIGGRRRRRGGDNARGSMRVARRHDGSTTLPITCGVVLYFCLVVSCICAEHSVMQLWKALVRYLLMASVCNICAENSVAHLWGSVAPEKLRGPWCGTFVWRGALVVASWQIRDTSWGSWSSLQPTSQAAPWPSPPPS